MREVSFHPDDRKAGQIFSHWEIVAFEHLCNSQFIEQAKNRNKGRVIYLSPFVFVLLKEMPLLIGHFPLSFLGFMRRSPMDLAYLSCWALTASRKTNVPMKGKPFIMA